MSDERSPADELREFREILVAERRGLIRQVLDHRERVRSLDGNVEATLGAKKGADLQAMQEQIEAVDRAIKDEEALAPSVYMTRGILGV